MKRQNRYQRKSTKDKAVKCGGTEEIEGLVAKKKKTIS